VEFEAALKVDPQKAVAQANIGRPSPCASAIQARVNAYGQAIAAGMQNCTTAAALGYAYEGAQDGQKAVEQLARRTSYAQG